MEAHERLFDVCIVCAMYEEAEAVLNEFSTRCNVSFSKAFSRRDRYEYRYTTIQNIHHEPLTVLVTWPSDRGPVQTGLDFKPFLDEFRPRFAAMTGICAGYKGKVKLGDLIVAECAYLYEEGKIITGPDGQAMQLLETKTVASTSQVLQYARGFEEWKAPLREMKQARLKRALKTNEEPKQHIAPIASGMAVRSDNPFPWLRERYHRNTIGLDMEAASFYRAFGAFSHIHALMVKGVSDYGDGSKNDRYHDYAAHASAVYLLTFILEYVNEQTMPRRDAPPPTDRAGPGSLFMVPYQRNPFFTGRDDLLMRLRTQLTTGKAAALTQPQAISGLGGIGKTQVALEYAYQHRKDYRYVFWVSAAIRETLLSDFVTIANLLRLPERNESDQKKVLMAVKKWFAAHQEWLLVLDNADDVAMVHDFVPTESQGHLVLTTRAQALGSLAQRIEVEKMGMVEGTLFLLHRTKLLAPNAFLDQASEEHLTGAEAIVIEMDFLPLALDQAGAYIEEVGCSLADYLELYQTRRKELLQRRSQLPTDHPEPVATTWSLSFQKVEQANFAAANLLRLCAFLEPDTIPENLISEGSGYLGSVLHRVAKDALKLNEAIEELRKFSLIQRNPETKMLRIHRLVQAVLRDAMKRRTQRRWAERAVRATNAVFPKEVEMETWSDCGQYLPQAQSCTVLIQDFSLAFEEVASLLDRTATYLKDHALYEQAELLYQRAVLIWEQTLGTDHPQLAQSLNSLAILYYEQRKLEQAESLYLRALHIREQIFGPDHSEVAILLGNLASLYRAQGKLEQAEPLYQRALHIHEQVLGPDHPKVAYALNGLAILYHDRGKFEQAEPLYQRALRIQEQVFGPDHPNVATVLNGLAVLYKEQGKFEQAEPLYQRALRIQEQVFGPDHPNVAIALNNLGNLYRVQEKFEQAEPLYQRAVHIREQVFGPDPIQAAHPLNNLANLYRAQGKFTQAESLYQRTLRIREQALGPDHPDIAETLHGLGNFYYQLEKFEQAEPLYRRAVRICEYRRGQHPDTAEILYDFAVCQESRGNSQEAASLYQRTLMIRTQVFGPQHPRTKETRERLRAVLHTLGKMEEAAQLDMA